MPRIDPIQLLKCISVLLSQRGGIKSQDEVQRLASLMTKYSKKLVSKCIYIQILKATETDLLGLFMGSGGWRLVHMWLTESIVSKNWPLIHELLELLLLCPVDIERLKTNNCPKLVKELSKEENYFAIRALASKLVEQWLKTVKGEQVIPISINNLSSIISSASIDDNVSSKKDVSIENHEILSNHVPKVDESQNENVELNGVKEINNVSDDITVNHNKNSEDAVIKAAPDKESETLPVLKISVKDGKQIISQIEDTDSNKVSEQKKSKEKSDKHSHSSSHKSSSSSSKDKNKSSSDKHSDSSSHKKSKHSSKSSSSSSEKRSSSHRSSSPSKGSSKDKSKDSLKSHSSRSKTDESNVKSSKDKDNKSYNKTKDKDERSKKNKEREKDRKSHTSDKDSKKEKDHKNHQTQATSPPSIHKVGKIPKLSDLKKDKLSISIEVRKPDEPKPKTVKTFHSKFRKHGLEEEIKPPPSRSTVLTKKVPNVAPPVVPKRTSPVHNDTPPPEKKTKILEIIDRPGAVKLIPAKPKPILLESDMFMDALNASTTTTKKDPKKRKRRSSISKDGNTASDSSPPQTPTNTSPSATETKSVPMRFYQETLETDESEDAPTNKSSENILDKTDSSIDLNNKENEDKMENSEPVTLTINGLKGILCYHKKKGPKKGIKWKSDIEEIQYFELDETERVNVTKTFTDMKYLERIHEQGAFQKGRNLSNDDVMEEKTNWRHLIPIDCEDQVVVEYGKNSKEKDIQASRQKGTLQPLYFNKSMIPDSPAEPDIEVHNYSEPRIIPLEDNTAATQDSISDFRNMPWPEPKGNAPVSSVNVNIQPMFQPPMAQFPGNFPNPQFGVPGFQPNMVPSEWQNGIPPPMMAPGMVPTPMMPGHMPPGGMPGPGMMMPPENMMMHPEMFNGPNGPMFVPPMAPEGFNMNGPPNMFSNDFNMPQEMPGPDKFHSGMRGRGHWRGGVNHNWEGPPRGRGSHSRGSRKPVCIYFQRKGSCRQGDKCAFLHTVSNRPY